MCIGVLADKSSNTHARSLIWAVGKLLCFSRTVNFMSHYKVLHIVAAHKLVICH